MMMVEQMCNAKTGTIDIYVGRRNWGRKEKVYVAYFSIPWDVWLLKAGVGTESASVASSMKTNTVYNIVIYKVTKAFLVPSRKLTS